MKGDPEERAAAVGRYIVERPRCRPSYRRTRPSVICAAARPHGANICIQHLARRTAAQYNRVKNKGRCTYETSGLHQLG